MLWVGVAANVVSLGMILGSLVLMKDGTIAERLGTAFAILAALSLLLIDGLIVWRALSGTRDINKKGFTGQLKECNTGRAARHARLSFLSLLRPCRQLPSRPPAVWSRRTEKTNHARLCASMV